MERSLQSAILPMGSLLPEFKLPNVDGHTISSADVKGSKAVLVVFTCNHCPYVKGSEAMLVTCAKTFMPQGLSVVTINSNDATQYPDDSFEKMQAKASAQQLPYPYLYDADQTVARRFDAACTPELYLFDSQMRLAFHGTLNDNPKDATQARKDYLTPAIEAVLAGRTPNPQFVHPLGCSIKWRLQ